MCYQPIHPIIDIHPEQDLIGSSNLEFIITVKQLMVDSIAMFFAIFINLVFRDHGPVWNSQAQ